MKKTFNAMAQRAKQRCILLLALYFAIIIAIGACNTPGQMLYICAVRDVDGDGIVSIREKRENVGIYVLQPVPGAQPEQILDVGESSRCGVSLSPDRRQFVYKKTVSRNGEPDWVSFFLYNVRADEAVELTPGPVTDLSATVYWARDGRKVALHSSDQSRILVFSAGGVFQREVEDVGLISDSSDSFEFSNMVTPDEKSQLFLGVTGWAIADPYLETLDLIEMQMNGELEDSAYPENIAIFFDGWSPDSTRMLWEEHGTSILASTLTVVEVDGSRRTPITDVDEAVVGAWSPNGREIAFISYRQDTDSDGTADTDRDSWAIYLVDADGGNRRRLLDDSYHVTWVDW